MIEQTPEHVFVSFFGDMRPPATTHLRAHLADLHMGGTKRVTMLFASPGGSTDDEIALFNFIKALHIEITMHAIGIVASMGIPIFLSAPLQRRRVAKSARFLFHESRWNLQGDITVAHMQEGVDHLSFSDEWALDLIERETKLFEKGFDRATLLKSSRYVSPEDAVKLGIAGACTEASIPLGAHIRTIGA